MDQVSRPLLIALAAAVMLAAVWLIALRPSSPETADAPAGPVAAVAKAKQASADADAANRRLQTATGGQRAATGTSAATAPATGASPAARTTATPKASTKREAAVLRDLRAGKVVVMLFWNGRSADDVATRAAVRGLDRRRGRVAVHLVPIGRVGRYPAITQGVTINQSPTTLVIDRRRRTRTIVGLTESGELGQVVGDALAGRR